MAVPQCWTGQNVFFFLNELELEHHVHHCRTIFFCAKFCIVTSCAWKRGGASFFQLQWHSITERDQRWTWCQMWTATPIADWQKGGVTKAERIIWAMSAAASTSKWLKSCLNCLSFFFFFFYSMLFQIAHPKLFPYIPFVICLVLVSGYVSLSNCYLRVWVNVFIKWE